MTPSLILSVGIWMPQQGQMFSIYRPFTSCPFSRSASMDSISAFTSVGKKYGLGT
jgi:hypothetical protein